MAWTETTPRQYGRKTTGHASDMADREWNLIAPFLPLARRLGRPHKTNLREAVNAILYIVRPAANGGHSRRAKLHMAWKMPQTGQGLAEIHRFSPACIMTAHI